MTLAGYYSPAFSVLSITKARLTELFATTTENQIKETKNVCS